MTEEMTALKEAVKAEVLAELKQKKRSDYPWRIAKSRLRDKVYKRIRDANVDSYRLVEAMATIGKAALGETNVMKFTENDMETVERMLDEILTVIEKYKNEREMT